MNNKLPFIKPSEITNEIIKELVAHCINGLTTDGAHHKQYDLEQILKILDPTDSIKKEREADPCYSLWDKGIKP